MYSDLLFSTSLVECAQRMLSNRGITFFELEITFINTRQLVFSGKLSVEFV